MIILIMPCFHNRHLLVGSLLNSRPVNLGVPGKQAVINIIAR